MLLLDLAKAYDRISHTAIWAVAQKMGIPRHGLQFLKAIYRNPVSWIMCNDFTSNQLLIQSGVRQGCPLSPIIFTLVAEILSQNLIKNTHLQGFKINRNITAKVISYADDTAIPITSVTDAKEFLKILKRYEQATASKANITKTCFVACSHHSPLTIC